MNQGRTVFSQLISFLPDREFRRCVDRYQGDLRLRGFTCWDQHLAMAFAQLTYRESLRHIEACLGSLQGKLYHLGFRGKVARSTLPRSSAKLERGFRWCQRQSDCTNENPHSRPKEGKLLRPRSGFRLRAHTHPGKSRCGTCPN